MPIKKKLYGQFKKPNGPVGALAGFIMAHRRSNIARNEWTIGLLDIQPTDRVLEIGYGPGVALGKAAELATNGKVFGIDHSKMMREQANNRNRNAVDRGRVALSIGTPKDLNGFCDSIDKVYSANVAQFWQDPTLEFGYIIKVMKAGGVIATTYLPRHSGAASKDTYAFKEKMSAA